MTDNGCKHGTVEVSVQAWFTVDLGESFIDDAADFNGLNDNGFELLCKECQQPITDLRIHQRVQRLLAVRAATWGASLPNMPTRYIEDGVELPALVASK